MRGRIRKFALENSINLLTENTVDVENRVRFAVLDKKDVNKIEQYVKSIVDDAVVEHVQDNVANPVLSKMQVNLEHRYTL